MCVGYTAIYGPIFTRVVCWFHVYKAYTKELRAVKDAKLYNAINDDIHVLQIYPSHDTFEAATKLWIKKWTLHANNSVQHFVSYFEENWITINSGWYEGMALCAPSTK